MKPGFPLLFCLALPVVAACAHAPPPPPPPPPGETMRAPPRGKSATPGVNRRQYLDQKTGRYYYFDPARGAYFWESGEPRV